MKKIAVDRSTPALIKPRYKGNQQMLEQVITLDPTHPEYPWKYSFEGYYAASGGKPEIYPMKHAVAVSLISDPQDRYKNLQFLVEKFILKGTKVTPEIQSLKDDLKHRVREASDTPGKAGGLMSRAASKAAGCDDFSPVA